MTDEMILESGKELRRGSAARDDRLHRPAPDRAGGRGLTGAANGERSPERINHRNGYRDRAWETRAGTVGLRIPKLRKGSHFPSRRPRRCYTTHRNTIALGKRWVPRPQHKAAGPRQQVVTTR
jgi:Transposase, Mutator family